MNIDDGFMSLMGDTGDTKDDIRLPGKKIAHWMISEQTLYHFIYAQQDI